MMFQDKQQLAMYMAGAALAISVYVLYKSRKEGFRPKVGIVKKAAPKPKGPFREAPMAAGMY